MEESQKELGGRIVKLEIWKKEIKSKLALVISVAVIVSGVFGFTLSNVYDSMKDTQDEIEALSGKLNGLSQLADEAASEANRALILVGDLETAVTSSKKASMDAAESSTDAKLSLREIKKAVDESTLSSKNAEESSKLAMDSANETKKLLGEMYASVQRANASAQAAKATARVVEDNVRQFDIALSETKDEIVSIIGSASAQQDSKPRAIPRVIEINIRGTGSRVTLKPGRSTFRKITIAETGYVGVVYIPDGYTALVNVNGVGHKVFVTKPLQGRATMYSKGVGNKLIERD